MASATYEHDTHGRSAERPRDIPKAGWKDILWRLKGKVGEDRLSIIAAGVAFYGLLSIFPALTALVALYGLAFNPDQVTQQVEALRGLLPAQAVQLLAGELRDLTQTDQAALGIGVAGGIVVALWSASSAVKTLMEALNVAYDEREKRGFFKLTALALALTLGLIVATIAAIALVVVLPAVIGFLGLGMLAQVARWAVWPVVAALAWVGIAVMYRYGPSRDEPQWQWLSWGAGLALFLWLIGSALFSWYVTSFGNYNKTYGSMAAVVILLMWFLLSAYAVLIGAEVNAEIERQTRKDTTVGKRQPLGERGAHAADTVGPAHS
jgi:membrane protein